MKRNQPEQALQIQATQLLQRILDPSVIFTAIGHGGGGKVRGAILKAMGVLPGLGDHCLMWRETLPTNHINTVYVPLGSYPQTCWIEYKVMKGRQSPAQKEFEARCKGIGHSYVVCRSLYDVVHALGQIGVPHRRVTVTA